MQKSRLQLALHRVLESEPWPQSIGPEYLGISLAALLIYDPHDGRSLHDLTVSLTARIDEILPSAISFERGVALGAALVLALQARELAT